LFMQPCGGYTGFVESYSVMDVCYITDSGNYTITTEDLGAFNSRTCTDRACTRCSIDRVFGGRGCGKYGDVYVQLSRVAQDDISLAPLWFRAS
jgi:hypothetical protein